MLVNLQLGLASCIVERSMLPCFSSGGCFLPVKASVCAVFRSDALAVNLVEYNII